MKAFLVLMVILGIGAGPAWAVDAGRLSVLSGALHQGADPLMADGANAYPVKPSDAALIAQKTVPDSKVLNVKLLPSGEYVVTLKAGGSVQKVMVNATTGATS